MSDLTTPAWRAVRTSLGFRIATLTLWYWRFDALADTRHFTELLPDQALSSMPAAGPASTRYVFPSYPVSTPPRPIQRWRGWLIYTPKTFPNYFVDLSAEGRFDGYLNRFSAKSRSTLKRKVRRFAEAAESGQTDFRVYRSEGEMREFLVLASALCANTYQARLLDAGLPSDQHFRDAAISGAAKGEARGFMLVLNERPVAYVFSTIRRGVATYDYVGHDPAMNHLSPGTVLQFLILEHLFTDRDVRIFDFTEGEGTHKAFFASGKSLCAKSFAFRATLRAQMIVMVHRLVLRVDQALDFMLERTALRQRLRRLIRR
jgi:CelD/BcsL family acetyltransferase involved in cellulose biosynthesis